MENPFNRLASYFGWSKPTTQPPEADRPNRGLIATLEAGATNGGIQHWVGPSMAQDAAMLQALVTQQVLRGPQGVKLPNFLPYIDEFTSGTGETTAIRRAYR